MSLSGRIAAIGVVLLIGGVAVVHLVGQTLDADAFPVWLTVLAIAFLISVGAFLVLRVPENKVSWLILVISAAVPLSVFGDLINGLSLFIIILPGLGVLLPLWFPTGQRPSRGWRWVEWATISGIGLFSTGVLQVAAGGGDISDVAGCDTSGGCLQILGLAAILLSTVAAFASLVVRWINSESLERQQLKWFTFAFAIFGIGTLAAFGGFESSAVARILFPLGVVVIPVSIVVAITRYRLYEIDRIISRTVGYTLVVGLLGIVYSVGAVWLPSRMTDDSPLFIAGSTLVVAAMFNPMRRRVLHWVDRRFYRSRFVAEQVIEQFSGRVRRETDAERLTSDLLGVVAATLQPRTMGVWIRESRIP